MALERIAVISDVHGNLTALEAVLADIESRGIERIINLGDCAGKGPRGSEVVDRCQEACSINIRGNWDEDLPRCRDTASEEMLWWRDELRQDQRDWLCTLPRSHDLLLSGRGIRLFHASATSPRVRVRANHSPEEFAGMFANTAMTGEGPEPSVVGYGDIHTTYLKTEGARTLLNVGSVGNPLDEPVPSYVILEGGVDAPEPAPFGLHVVRVPYDIEAEIGVAEALGMPALMPYAIELRTSVYRRLQHV